MLYRFLLIFFVLTAISCINSKDYDLNSVTISPTLALPLATGNIGVLDLASSLDSSYLKTYSDGLLYFSYTQTYPSRGIRDLFTLSPNNSFNTSFDLPTGTLPPSSNDVQFATFNQTIDFGFSPGQLSEMLLKGGSVNYTISTSPNNPNLPYEVNFSTTDIIQKSSQSPLIFKAGAGTGSTPLTDYIIKMDKNTFKMKIDVVLKKRATSVFIAGNTKINVKLSFKIDFSYVKGFFGDQIINVPTQTIDLTVFNSALNKAKVSFVNPVLKLSVQNEYGVPCEVSFTNIIAKKNNTVIPFQLNPGNPISLNYPTTLGAFAKTDIAITNASDIITLSPKQLIYSANSRINKGLTTGSDFMADSSKLKVSMIAEFPLYGSASNISLYDTLKLDLSSVDQSTVTTASLRVRAQNQLPLDANLQLYLTDASYHVIDSLFSPNQTFLVKSSTVTAAGELLTTGINDQKIDLLPDKLNKIFTSSYIIIRSKLNTTKDINGTYLNVKFKAAYKLKLDVGLLAKLNISTK